MHGNGNLEPIHRTLRGEMDPEMMSLNMRLARAEQRQTRREQRRIRARAERDAQAISDAVRDRWDSLVLETGS